MSYNGASISINNARFLQNDARGSIVYSSDRYDSAASRVINTYDEYGQPGAGNEGRFQYTGQVWLPELGMYYYKARIYSPALGRFMQTDPIGYEDQVNLYGYVGNDPINMLDATGQRAIRVEEANGSVTYQILIAFTGPDAGNPVAQTAIISRLAGLNTPNGEKIEVIVVDGRHADSRGVNEVRLRAGGWLGVSGGCTVDHSCAYSTRDLALVNSTATDVGDVGGHEVGHSLRASDGYTEGPRDTSGARQFGPTDTKPTQDIMTRRNGTDLTQQSIDEIDRRAINVDTRANRYVCRVNPEYSGC